MLRRDRQLRTQIYQVKDAALFAVGLWVAHFWRDHFPEEWLFWKFGAIDPFARFIWIYLVIIPGVPLILESMGFYQRPVFASRRETAWILLKACAMATVGVILVIYLSRQNTLARGVIVMFGAISFILVFLSEELMRAGYRSRFGQLQMKRRFVLVGAPEDTARMKMELRDKNVDNIEILADL